MKILHLAVSERYTILVSGDMYADLTCRKLSLGRRKTWVLLYLALLNVDVLNSGRYTSNKLHDLVRMPAFVNEGRAHSPHVTSVEDHQNYKAIKWVLTFRDTGR